MKKLFKFLMWLIIVLIILIVAVYLTAGFWLRTAVSTIIPEMTKTSASLQKADISLFSGKIALKGFKIANPEGFKSPNAFELGEISVKFEPKSIFTSKIVINEIKIDGTKIDAELAKSGNMNLMILNDNIQEYLGNKVEVKAIPEKKEVVKKDNNTGKAVLVQDLQITNSSLKFAILTQTMTVPLPNIHEKNIGQKDKTTLKDLFAGIFGQLTVSSLNQITQSGQKALNSMLDDLTKRTNQAKPVRDLINQFPSMF